MSEVSWPKDWAKCSLGSVLELKYGKSLPAKNRDGGQYPVFGSNGIVGSHSQPLVETKGIIVGRKGSYGEVQISETPFFPIDTTYYVDDLAGQPLKYWFHQLSFLPLNELNRSTAIPGLNREDAYAQQICLPPLAEQKVIADKLDTLLAQVETTKQRLEHVSGILKRFRQSVLSAAVRGKLTDEWRGEELAWNEKTLQEIASNIVDCPHSTPKWSDFGKYCVRTTAFNPFFLDLSDQGFVSEEVYQERIKRLKPESGDILYSREGTVGVACQIPEGVELCLGQRMVLIRAGEECDPKYLTMVLNSDKILSIVRSKITGSTAPRVNMKDIRSYPIPIPSKEEQTEIVYRVEQLFAYANTIELEVRGAMTRVNHLTQSILGKAFRGELSAEWRDANPALISGVNSAEALLDKIIAKKESNSKKDKVRVSVKRENMKKITKEDLKEWVTNYQDNTFTFDILKNSISSDYDELKEVLFDALSEKKPLFKQVFDEKLGTVRFSKVVA